MTDTPKTQDLGRNDPCHCGSGKKYKKCHQEKDEATQHAALETQHKAALTSLEAAAAEEKADEKSPSHAPTSKPQAGPKQTRHQSFVGPKINMPRRTGGGG